MNTTKYQIKTDTPLRLLMVEDSAEETLLMICALRDEGYQAECERVKTATDMIAALENQNWDLIISNSNLPQFDGLEVISILKKMRRNIPLIIVCDSMEEEKMTNLKDAGVNDVVLKKHFPKFASNLKNIVLSPPKKPATANAEALSTNKITDQELLSAKILIVDDDPKNIAVIQQVMEMAGYENIRFTSDPREVCDLYQEIWPDLLLLDLNMPYMDGFQVMEELKKIEQRDYIPILVLTAQTDRESRIKALKAGAKDFLLKPFDLVEVIHRIQNILEVRLLHNKLRHQNFHLEEKVLERTKELYNTQLSIVQRLGRAAEYRDNETSNHVLRMSKTASILAKHLGFDEEHCELILNAAPMHDIGKIGIPDGILLKPGKHDLEGWGVMRTHAEIGYQILADDTSDLMQLAAEISLQHHEKWDGTGYPNTLKGQEIS
nr:response regulator [Nitrospinota bacterium]